MNEKNDKWLDEIISKTINTKKPQFDAEKFKQKFPNELNMLQSRASQQGLINWACIFKNPISKLAIAAVIILTVGFLMFYLKPDEDIDIPDISNVPQSPANIMSMMSLRNAYRRGGIEELDRQLNETLDMYGPVVSNDSIQNLFESINGS